MAKYSASSPWYDTKENNLYLEMWEPRPIPSADDDFQYTIQPQYSYRPDLLAYDIYGTASLWWVFTQRNLDVIQDPIFDFVPGVQIYLPKSSSLKAVLGV